jgi:hypothetical protein
LALR